MSNNLMPCYCPSVNDKEVINEVHNLCGGHYTVQKKVKSVQRNVHSPQSKGEDALARPTKEGTLGDKASIPDGAICKPETLADINNQEVKS